MINYTEAAFEGVSTTQQDAGEALIKRRPIDLGGGVYVCTRKDRQGSPLRQYVALPPGELVRLRDTLDAIIKGQDEERAIKVCQLDPVTLKPLA